MGKGLIVVVPVSSYSEGDLLHDVELYLSYKIFSRCFKHSSQSRAIAARSRWSGVEVGRDGAAAVRRVFSSRPLLQSRSKNRPFRVVEVLFSSI